MARARLLGVLVAAMMVWASIAFAGAYTSGVTLEEIDAWSGRWRAYFSFSNDKPVLYIEFGCKDPSGVLDKITVYPPTNTKEYNLTMTCRVKDIAKTKFFVRAYVPSQRRFRIFEGGIVIPNTIPQILGGWGVIYPGRGDVEDLRPPTNGCYIQRRPGEPITLRPEGEEWIVGPGDVYVCRNGRWQREPVGTLPFQNVLLATGGYIGLRDTKTAIALFNGRNGGQVRVESGCPVVWMRGAVDFFRVGEYFLGYRCTKGPSGYYWATNRTYTRTPRRG